MQLRYLILVVVLGVVCQFADPATAVARQRERVPAFRADVDLVTLAVTVTDQEEHFVRQLGAPDFAVFEDGVRQEISFFSAERAPLDLTILLDTSSSMTGYMEAAQQAAAGLAGSIAPGDRVMVMGVSGRSYILYPLSGDLPAVLDAIHSARAVGSTALYNALYLAISQMVRQRQQPTEVRRQAIAVLSDGLDTASLVNYDDLMDDLKQSGITTYSIAFAPLTPPVVSSRIRPHALQPLFVMRSFAQETGGRFLLARDATELARLYANVAEELGQQYTIAYTSKNAKRDGNFRRVSVRVVGRSGLAARTRPGYYAARAESTTSRR